MILPSKIMAGWWRWLAIAGIAPGLAAQTNPTPTSSVGAPASAPNTVGMTLVRVPAGEFRMGQDARQVTYRAPWTPEKDRGADADEQPAHGVTLSHGFAIARTEVTNAQYEQFDPTHRALRSRGAVDEDAVVNVTWEDAVSFCLWLSAKEKKPYRLPTEAEWEYACRAGTTTLFAYGDDLPDSFQEISAAELIAYPHWFPVGATPAPWYRVVKASATRVAQRGPNPWGLHDMHGNVEEWCFDWYGPYEGQPQFDPIGRASGDFRVVRGGATSQWARLLRSANRSAMPPNLRTPKIGFRVVQGPLPLSAPLPAAPLPRYAERVAPTHPRARDIPSARPFFAGPRPYVNVPPNSMGPVFSKHNHDPAISVCPNGDLLAIWYSTEEEPGPELAVVASRLRPGETEWEPASCFWDTADRNDHGPALWYDGDQTLFHFNGNKELPGSILRTSRDNGVTWSRPVQFSTLTQANEAIVRTKSGRLLVTVDAPFESSAVEASDDQGQTWFSLTDKSVRPDFAPGKTGRLIAGIHCGLVELRDGQLLAFGRFDNIEREKTFGQCNPLSISSDGGRTWTYGLSPHPAISSGQRFTMKRLREGPIILCTYTEMLAKKDDSGRVLGAKPKNERVGLRFPNHAGGEVTGFGLYATVSFDEGQTWTTRRLVTPGGPPVAQVTVDGNRFTLGETEAEPSGYLAMCQDLQGVIHVISSRNHYSFNLAWLTERK